MMWDKIRSSRWYVNSKKTFSQGLTPRQLALSISISIVFGIIPFFGITTFVVTMIAVWMRLNLAIVIFITYAVSPLHILMFIPFMRFGEWILGSQSSLLTIAGIKEAFSTDYWQALSDLGWQIGYGLVGWCIAAVPAIYLLYIIIKFVIDMTNMNRQPADL